jgi:O-antigen/teichoic acid export membrane protein
MPVPVAAEPRDPAGVSTGPGVGTNLIANTAGSIVTSLIQLAIIPVYIRLLGPESYGLVGVLTLLQGLVQILDFGVSASVNRELARRIALRRPAVETRNFVRTLEVGYNLLGLLLGVFVFVTAPLADRWLNPAALSSEAVRQSIRAMALVIACQWPLTFYQGALLGLQRHGVLNVIRSASAAVSAVGAYVVLSRIAATPVALFTWLAAIALFQTALLGLWTWRSLPGGVDAARVDRASVAGIWTFALRMSGITVTALLLSQIDRLVTSRLLPLETFGYYALGATVANAVLYTFVSPVYASVFPRLSALAAMEDAARLRRAYRLAWATMMLLVVPAAAVLSFFARPLLHAWTGNAVAADVAGPIAALLVNGMALYGLLSITSALQLAHGWTGLALAINVVLCAVAVPSVILLTRGFGPVGAAAMWPAINVCYAAMTIPITHRRAAEAGGSRWLLADIAVPSALVVLVTWGLRTGLGDVTAHTAATLAAAGVTWLAAVVCLVAASPSLRRAANALVAHRRLADVMR